MHLGGGGGGLVVGMAGIGWISPRAVGVKGGMGGVGMEDGQKDLPRQGSNLTVLRLLPEGDPTGFHRRQC